MPNWYSKAAELQFKRLLEQVTLEIRVFLKGAFFFYFFINCSRYFFYFLSFLFEIDLRLTY